MYDTENSFDRVTCLSEVSIFVRGGPGNAQLTQINARKSHPLGTTLERIDWLAESLIAQPSRGNDLVDRELRLLDILSCEARSGMTCVVARQRLPRLATQILKTPRLSQGT